MQLTLDYGKSGLPVDILEGTNIAVLEVLEQAPASPLPNPEQVLQEALLAPIGTPPLAELAHGKQSACVLICDVTRPVPNSLLLPAILETLESAGIPRESILILIATGLHRPNEGDEIVELVGPEVAAKYRVENHHGQVREEHRYLGESPRGVPVWIDQRYLDADLKIATGLIEPHLMAGYSGGRKLICPGIASIDTVRVWHGPDFLEHPLADAGNLEGNPVHEENTAIAQMAGCDFIVNVALDRERRVTHLVAGHMVEAFHAGVEFVASIVRVPVDAPYDIVVTSAAGYPLDTTFYQSIKGLTGAWPIVKQGGTIILAASLTEGIGSPEFQQILREHDSLEAFMQRILGKNYFVMDQWQLEEMAKVCRRARVKYVSDGMPASSLNELFVEAAPSVEEALAECMASLTEPARVAVIPEGPYVLPHLVD